MTLNSVFITTIYCFGRLAELYFFMKLYMYSRAILYIIEKVGIMVLRFVLKKKHAGTLSFHGTATPQRTRG